MNCHHRHETCSECWWDEVLGRNQCNHYYRYERPYYRYYERPYYRYNRYDDGALQLEAFSLVILGACKGTSFLAKFATKQAKKAHRKMRVRHLGAAA